MKKLFPLYFLSFGTLTLTAQKSTDSTPSKKKTSSIKTVLAFKESMEMKNMEHSFINMDEYLSSKIVAKRINLLFFLGKKTAQNRKNLLPMTLLLILPSLFTRRLHKDFYLFRTTPFNMRIIGKDKQNP